MADIRQPMVNFSKDLRSLARTAAFVLWGGAALFSLTAFWLISAGLEARSDAAASAAIQEKLGEQLELAKARAADAPQPDAYRSLRNRVERLNVLDFAGSASTGKLLDAIEGLLPPGSRSPLWITTAPSEPWTSSPSRKRARLSRPCSMCSTGIRFSRRSASWIRSRRRAC